MAGVENNPMSTRYDNIIKRNQGATSTVSGKSSSSSSVDATYEAAYAKAQADAANIERTGGSDTDTTNTELKELQDMYNDLLNEMEDQKPGALEYIETSLTGLAQVATACQGFFGDDNGTTTQGAGGAGKGSVAGGGSDLDNAVNDFKNGKEGSEAALRSQLEASHTQLDGLNGQISDKKGDIAALEKQLKDANYDSVMQQLTDGIKTSKTAYDNATKTIETCTQQRETISQAISSNSAALSENENATITVTGLSEEAKQQFGVQDGNVEIKKSEYAEQDKSLKQVLDAYSAKEGECADAERNVGTCESNLQTATQNHTDAVTTLGKTPKTKVIEKKGADGKTVKQTVANPDYEQAVTREQETKRLENDAKTKLQQAKEDKAKKDGELTDLGKQIQVGEKTLDQILQEQHQAEEARDKAKADIESYAQELTKYTDEKQILSTKGENLITQEQTNNASLDAGQQIADAIIKGNVDVDSLSSLKVDVNEAKKTTQDKLSAAKDELKSLEGQKSNLEKSIQEANKALGQKKNDGIDKSGGKAPSSSAGTPTSDNGDGRDAPKAPSNPNSGTDVITQRTLDLLGKKIPGREE